MPSSVKTGTITESKFRKGLGKWTTSIKIKKAWHQYGASREWPWDWTLEEQGALARLEIRREYSSDDKQEELDDEEELDAGHADNDAQEDPCLLPQSTSCSRRSIDWELCIMYDAIYQAPTLWFNASYDDGLPLTMKEIREVLPKEVGGILLQEDWQMIDADSQKKEVALPLYHEVVESGQGRQHLERWTVMSQDEHPYWGYSCFFLHPCASAARMACLLSPVPSPSSSLPCCLTDDHCNCNNKQQTKEFYLHNDNDNDNDDQSNGSITEQQQQEGGLVHEEEGDEEGGLDYLIKWFGLVAPVLGLSYPPAFSIAMLTT